MTTNFLLHFVSFIVSCILVFHVPILTSAREISDKGNQENGKEWYENKKMINFQKQILLNKILQSLHMKERPPKVRKKINEDNFPSEIFSDTFNHLGVENIGNRRIEKKMQIILLADKLIKDSKTIIQFKISGKYCRDYKILGAKLSLYVDRAVNTRQSNDIYAVSNQNFTVSKSLAKNGWIHFDIKEAMQSCKGKRLSFEISCIKCKHNIFLSPKERYKPYITISVPDSKRMRTRRQESCSKSFSCCSRNFYMNFTAIGWSDWIYKPKGFMTNYCGGVCHKPGEDIISRSAGETKSRCCVPTEKEGITLFFIDGKTGMYYRKTIENIVIKKCGCTS